VTGSLGTLASTGSAGAVKALSAVAPTIPAPHIEYGQLSPMLLVFGAAVAGVFVEAFAPRPLRRTLHLPITLGSLAAAFVLTIVVAVSISGGHIDAAGAVAVDQPTLFIQGTILVLAFISVLLVAESSHEVSAFAA
jgi:NADH-quinone oxidoreductase subunit N